MPRKLSVKGKMYELTSVKGAQNDDTTFSGEVHSQPPHQSRAIWRVNIAGEMLTITEVHNHDKGWNREMDGESQTADPTALTGMQQSDYVDYLASLIPLLDDKALELSAVPDAKVHGHSSAAILVKSKGQPDVRLYFDRDTGLLIKTEYRCAA